MKCLLQRCSDRRLKLTNELLQGIKLLKMYAWEELYSKAIEVVRKAEMRNILYINLCLISTGKSSGIFFWVNLQGELKKCTGNL